MPDFSPTVEDSFLRSLFSNAVHSYPIPEDERRIKKRMDYFNNPRKESAVDADEVQTNEMQRPSRKETPDTPAKINRPETGDRPAKNDDDSGFLGLPAEFWTKLGVFSQGLASGGSRRGTTFMGALADAGANLNAYEEAEQERENRALLEFMKQQSLNEHRENQLGLSRERNELTRQRNNIYASKGGGTKDKPVVNEDKIYVDLLGKENPDTGVPYTPAEAAALARESVDAFHRSQGSDKRSDADLLSELNRRGY